MTRAEIDERFDRLRDTLLNWADPILVERIGLEHVKAIEEILLGKSYDRFNMDMVVKALTGSTNLPTVHDYLKARSAATLVAIDRCLEGIPRNDGTRLDWDRARAAFELRYTPYANEDLESWPKLIDQFRPTVTRVECVAISEPFCMNYKYFAGTLLRMSLNWESDTAQAVTDVQPNVTPLHRIEWRASTAAFVHIVGELMRQGYIELPGMNAKGGDGNVTEMFRRLSQAIVVRGRGEKELSPEELQRRFQGRKLSDAKSARLSFPKVEEL